MDTAYRILMDRLERRTATIGVIGLGYVGLPLIHVIVKAGYMALGFDIDLRKVSSLNEGKSYIGHISSEWLQSWITSKRFRATADVSDLRSADAIIICVPTPLSASRDPDLSYVVSTVQQIATVLRPGQLIVLESTTYPGTTRDVVLPELLKSGLRPGEDFFVAFSPEREDPGNRQFSADKIPKVVGGYDEPSRLAAEALYRVVDHPQRGDSGGAASPLERPARLADHREGRNRHQQPALPGSSQKHWRLSDQAARNASSGRGGSQAAEENQAAAIGQRVAVA